MGLVLTQIVTSAITNWGSFMLLKVGASVNANWGSFFYSELEQVLLQFEAAHLLQIGTSFITNQGSYYKLGQPLLQIGA